MAQKTGRELMAAGQGFEPQLPGPEEAACPAAEGPVLGLAMGSADFRTLVGPRCGLSRIAVDSALFGH